MSDKTKIPLESDKYYHIYNHANGKDNLFVNKGNFNFFLKRYAFYISSIADTFAYCLMPNHFHLAIRIKSDDELQNLQGFQNLEGLNNHRDLSKKLSQQFSNLFNSYTKAFNKQQNRRGSLFVPNFSRKHINSEEYFRKVIHYIHYNPVHHEFVDDLRDWKYSSFESFFSKKATKLKREEVIEWFDNKENFWAFHQREIDEKMTIDLEKF